MKLGARRGAKVSTTTRRGPTMDENHPLLLQHTPLSYYGIIRYKSTNTIRPLLNTQQPDNRMAAAIRYSRVEGTGDGYLVTMNNSAQNASPFTFSHPGMAVDGAFGRIVTINLLSINYGPHTVALPVK